MLRCVMFFIKKVVLWDQHMIKNDLKLGTFPTMAQYKRSCHQTAIDIRSRHSYKPFDSEEFIREFDS